MLKSGSVTRLGGMIARIQTACGLRLLYSRAVRDGNLLFVMHAELLHVLDLRLSRPAAATA
jgi:hypothetical protein